MWALFSQHWAESTAQLLSSFQERMTEQLFFFLLQFSFLEFIFKKTLKSGKCIYQKQKNKKKTETETQHEFPETIFPKTARGGTAHELAWS